VQRSLRGLVQDLEVRAGILHESLPAPAPAEIEARVNDVRGRVASLRTEAQALLTESLETSKDAASHLDRHLRISGPLQSLEQFDAPVLTRWSEADRLVTVMCHALLVQVGWPYEPPLVGAASTDYYWVYPPRAIISIPANEEKRLLAVGDLCHELGHIVFTQASKDLTHRALEAVKEHIKQVAASPPAGMNLSRVTEFAVDLSLSWRQWIQEFVCDAIAVFLVGPAFARQHIRLTCIQDSRATLFEAPPGAPHPADDARMRSVLSMLRQIDCADAADELAECWQGVIAAYGESPPDLYDTLYPDDVLIALVEGVDEVCERRGLRRYPGELEDSDVASLANLAWRALRDDPEGYRDWEREALERCLPGWEAVASAS
jgi:hypothetical protein